MEQMKRKAGAVMATVCTALLAAAVIGNLFVGTVEEASLAAAEPTMADSAVWEEQFMAEQTEQAVAAGDRQKTALTDNTQRLANRLASLRMERDQSWQRLQSGMDHLQTEEKMEWKNRYAMLQYKEQRLELLLQAKGIMHCLAVLEEEQANIIVSEEELEGQYAKLYDLVERNSGYPAEQIVLIPLRAE